MVKNDKYCLGFAYDLECNTLIWTGLIFPDGSTTKKTECVQLNGVTKWTFLQSCYFGNYLNVNIKKKSHICIKCIKFFTAK